MTVIHYKDEDLFIPNDLQNRVNANILNHDEWYYERKEKRHASKLAVVCAFSEGREFFEVYFGFAKASKINHDDITKQEMYSLPQKFLFCSLLVSDPRVKPYRIHGRNDFEDDDFEKIAEYVTTHTRPKGKIYEIVNDYKLNDYNKNILNLCQDRIDGFILGPKTT
jgi:hypothetical protein